MKKVGPIIISGSIAIDRIMGFDGRYRDRLQPEMLDRLSVSLLLDRLVESHGGVGANIAYSLALLGETPVLVGSAGKDAVAYLEKLAHAGVNIAHVHESDLPTASFNVITDSDENQLGGFYPGAMLDSEALSFEPWRQADPLVVVSPHDPKAMRRQVAECARWDLRLCYDVGQQVSNLPAEDMAAGVDAAEILVVNEYEMTALASRLERSIEAIKQRVPVVITTLGKHGSVIEGANVPQPIRIGVVKPRKMADPTGAGDAFRAGFLYGYARSWELKACGELGATCATYAVEQVGTQNHAFTLGEISDRYKASFDAALPEVLTTI